MRWGWGRLWGRRPRVYLWRPRGLCPGRLGRGRFTAGGVALSAVCFRGPFLTSSRLGLLVALSSLLIGVSPVFLITELELFSVVDLLMGPCPTIIILLVQLVKLFEVILFKNGRPTHRFYKAHWWPRAPGAYHTGKSAGPIRSGVSVRPLGSIGRREREIWGIHEGRHHSSVGRELGWTRRLQSPPEVMAMMKFGVRALQLIRATPTSVPPSCRILGAEAWSGPRRLFGRLPFLGSFVLVASRLQGRKFLSRES